MDNEFDQSKESRIQRKRTSLVASLVASLQKDEHIEAKKNEQEKTVKDLARNEILHEMFLFLVAGFETDATSLAWFIHLVRINPVVYFSLKTSTIYFPSANITVDQIDNGPIEQDIITHNIKTRSYNPKVALRCNRGMNARLWLGGKMYNYRCFCPPSYYGSMNNQSICVCPNNKLAPRCLLTSCLSNTCQNNGRLTKKKFSCICPNEFYGTKYEYRKIRLDISFEKMASPSHILIYISIMSNGSYRKHMVMFQKLKHKQHSVTFRILEAFHIVFAKINHNYFLIVLQQYPRHFISTSISSNRQCAPINELFNSTVMTMAYI
ncbi:unnamed protein product [Rotaria sordida]|uniref:Uncharacterized protein n=1 Tax=Rotaria sordida TaxID=392033 RepID=A0A818WYZ8_9BILA|nr:unnamed protein product [Rotaria sordida]CAF3731522.1 unnamed protein product [Rotaria sordida]